MWTPVRPRSSERCSAGPTASFAARGARASVGWHLRVDQWELFSPPGEICDHAGRPRVCDLDSFPERILQDLGGAKKSRGSLDFRQWRVPALGVLVANSCSSIPVGLYIQTPLNALLGPYAPDPRSLTHVIGWSQFSDEAHEPQDGENLPSVLKFAPAQKTQSCFPRPFSPPQPH